MFRTSAYSVTVEQFAVLTVLWYENGINQNEIAHRLNRDKTTIARVISNMLKHDYIEKKADNDDQRNRKVSLTPLGKKVHQDLVQLTAEVYNQALKNLNDGALSQGINTLTRIKDNLK